MRDHENRIGNIYSTSSGNLQNTARGGLPPAPLGSEKSMSTLDTGDEQRVMHMESFVSGYTIDENMQGFVAPAAPAPAKQPGE